MAQDETAKSNYNPDKQLLNSNRYYLVERLGAGGFGLVFLANDSKFNPPRQVAIKFLISEILNEDKVRQEIKREADILARLRHPNILRVIDFEITSDKAFLVTEFAEGGSLADKLRSVKRLPLEQVELYLEQLASAIDEAHKKEIIHRDIKPQNILFDGNRPLIADFGLATALSQSQNSSSLIDTTADGTPAYMAPEQWNGQAGRASDIYALAVVIYKMITGETPFQVNAQANKYGLNEQLKRQHLYAQVPSISLRAPDLVYPPALDQVIAKAMAKNPKERPRSAKEFYESFKQAINSPPSPKISPSPSVAETIIIDPLPGNKPVAKQSKWEREGNGQLKLARVKLPRLRAGLIWGIAAGVLLAGIIFIMLFSNQSNSKSSIGTQTVETTANLTVVSPQVLVTSSPSTAVTVPTSATLIASTATFAPTQPQPQTPSVVTQQPTVELKVNSPIDVLEQKARSSNPVVNFPSKEILEDSLEIHQKENAAPRGAINDKKLRNFKMEATFSDVFFSGDRGTGADWDYGFQFRDNAEQGFIYWLGVNSNKKWQLTFCQPGAKGCQNTFSGNLGSWLKTSPQESNTLTLYVYETKGYLCVNGLTQCTNAFDLPWVGEGFNWLIAFIPTPGTKPFTIKVTVSNFKLWNLD